MDIEADPKKIPTWTNAQRVRNKLMTVNDEYQKQKKRELVTRATFREWTPVQPEDAVKLCEWILDEIVDTIINKWSDKLKELKIGRMVHWHLTHPTNGNVHARNSMLLLFFHWG